MQLKNKRILITGGAGFIGSHLVDALVEHNSVKVIDNLSSGKLEFLKKYCGTNNFTFIQEDLLNADELLKHFSGIDIVFHLAANADIRVAESDTHIHLNQCVMATHNVLEACRQARVKHLAFTSTSTVYGEATVPTPEDYGPLKPISIYGGAKLACEGFITAYAHHAGIKSWIFRFANIIGSRGTHGVIRDFILKLKNNSKELEILGDGKQRKSYLLVQDCVNAMIFAVENTDEAVNIFNIGSFDTIDVLEIARLVATKMDLNPEFTTTGTKRGWVGDVTRMQLSIDALIDAGWRPEYNSRKSVAETVEALLEEL